MIFYISNKNNAPASNDFMKRILLIAVAISTVFQAKAQLFSPESLTGAALGGLIGGYAGGSGHCGNSFSGNNAAIGAGIGLAAGALVGAVNRQNADNFQSYSYAPQPYPQPGYGYAYPSSAYAYPVSVSAPRPNYMVGGTLIGAASGALIGSGIDHQAGEGALIGAGAGLLLGGISEYAAKKREGKVSSANRPMVQSQPVPQSQPLPQAEGNWPKHGPNNTTYYWTRPSAFAVPN